MFKYSPDCLILDESSGFEINFLVQSKKSLFSTSGELYRYQMLFHQGSVNPESIKKWVIDRTVLLGNLDFANLGRFWGLPAPVVHTIKLERILQSATDSENQTLIDKINEFKYPLYYF